MSYTLRPVVRGHVLRPGFWMATFTFVNPDGSVFPAKRNGPESREMIRAKTLKEAEREAERHESYLRSKYGTGQLVTVARDDVAEVRRSGIPTVKAFFPVWVDELKANKRKPSSVEAIESIFFTHIEPFIGTKRLDQVSDRVKNELILKWEAGGYEDRQGRKVKATKKDATINNRLTVLSSMLTYACEATPVVLEKMPCKIRMRAVDKAAREVAFYDVETYERLVAAAARIDPRMLCVVLLAGDDGLRRNEVIAINLDDVDFVRGEITVRRSVFVRRKQISETTPKGAKAKTVPVTARLLAALKACRHLRGPRLLYTDDGKALTPKVIKRWMMRIERAAALPETGRIHVLRHSFCTHMANAGVPARTIQALARHSDLKTTEMYLHSSPEVVQLGVDMLAKSRALGGVPVIGEPIAARRK